MQLFSTILNIQNTLTHEKFVDLIIRWNQGSPHPNNKIENIEWDGSYNVKFVHDNLKLEIEEYRNENIIAARFEKLEDGVIWDSDYIMNFNDMKMVVRLERSFTEDAKEIRSQFATPHFLKMLIEEGFVVPDNGLEVSFISTNINEGNVKLLAQIINSEIKFSLPVVYVSKTYDNNDPLDVDRLARYLRGVAHVLIQESSDTSSMIRQRCNDKNPYYGAIGIYYPTTTYHKNRFLYKPFMDPEYVLKTITRTVIDYTTSQEHGDLYTWEGVRRALLRDRLHSQYQKRTSAERDVKEIEELLESVDNEIAELQKENEELNQKIRNLQSENNVYKSTFNRSKNNPVLNYGNEEDYYPNEIKEFVLEELSKSLVGIQRDTRRYHIISDVIEKNEYTGLLREKKEKIKQLLKNYSGLNPKLEQNLKELGFTVIAEKDHYKLIYKDDARYTFIMAKTPSDNHAGANNASVINTNVF